MPREFEESINQAVSDGQLDGQLLEAVRQRNWDFLKKHLTEDISAEILLAMVNELFDQENVNNSIIDQLISLNKWEDIPAKEIEQLIDKGLSKDRPFFLKDLCQKRNAPCAEFIEHLCYIFCIFKKNKEMIQELCEKATYKPNKTQLLNCLVGEWLEKFDDDFDKAPFKLTPALITFLKPLQECEEALLENLLTYAIKNKDLAFIKTLCQLETNKPTPVMINQAIKTAMLGIQDHKNREILSYLSNVYDLDQDVIGEIIFIAAFEERGQWNDTLMLDYFTNLNIFPRKNVLDNTLVAIAQLSYEKESGYVVSKLLSLPEARRPSMEAIQKARDITPSENIKLILSLVAEEPSQDKIDNVLKTAALKGYLDVAWFLIDHFRPNQEAIDEAFQIAVKHPHMDMVTIFCQSEQCSPSRLTIREMHLFVWQNKKKYYGPPETITPFRPSYFLDGNNLAFDGMWKKLLSLLQTCLNKTRVLVSRDVKISSNQPNVSVDLSDKATVILLPAVKKDSPRQDLCANLETYIKKREEAEFNYSPGFFGLKKHFIFESQRATQEANVRLAKDCLDKFLRGELNSSHLTTQKLKETRNSLTSDLACRKRGFTALNKIIRDLRKEFPEEKKSCCIHF